MARIIPICNKAINISKILGQKRVCFLKIIKVRGEYSMKILARKIKFVTTIMFLSWTGFFTIPSFAQSLAADAPDLPFGEYLTARHALFNNQYNDAAENYLKALELDPENIILGQFTMSVLVTDGRVDEAIKIAHRLKAMGEEKYDAKKIKKRFRDNAVYVGYAPYEAPEIAIAVVVENAGHGGEEAAPIARKVMDEYFKGLKQKTASLAANLAVNQLSTRSH